uniref:Uncharacterized protein n=1 Tax=Caenorhabditis japonica TaxID=281687 RepID=A0A8R1IAR9_CAEJA
MATTTLDKTDVPELAKLGITDLDEGKVPSAEENHQIQMVEKIEIDEKERNTTTNDDTITMIAQKLTRLIVNSQKTERKWDHEFEKQRIRASNIADQLLEATPATEQLVDAFNNLVEGLVPTIKKIDEANERVQEEIKKSSTVIEENSKQIKSQAETILKLSKTINDLHITMAHQSAAKYKQQLEDLPRKKPRIDEDMRSTTQNVGIRRCYICTGVHQADECDQYKDGPTRLEEMTKRNRCIRCTKKKCTWTPVSISKRPHVHLLPERPLERSLPRQIPDRHYASKENGPRNSTL